MKYFALLTKLGENLLAQATALGTKLELTQMAVGDGGGSLPTPDTNQTKLIAEKRRAAINTLFIDEQNKNQIIAEQIIPEQDGGWWIREIGLFDKAGNLIAVANCPETYKPQLAEGSGRTQSIRMVLIVSHTESVTLKIDPSVVLATREYVNTEITVLDKKIDALSAQTKLDLNNKFDKANISGVKGNDNDKVPSLNLFTTEIGKLAARGYSYSKIESDGRYQPKGNYAPAGDYATNTALNNGLASKFDKSGGTISGDVTFSKNAIKSTKGTHALPDKSGTLMQVGDYGFGGNGSGTGLWANWTAAQVENFFKTGASSIWRNQQETTRYGARYGANLYVCSSDAFWNMNVNHASGDVLISNGLTGQDPSTFKIAKLFSTLNTTPDRNGHLKIAGASAELSDCQVGIPLPWPQATAPAGYLICNGQTFNKATYPLLALAYPSGVLPDLRGEFIRGLDAGRGIDANRTVLAAQGDAIRNIAGTFSADAIISLSSSGAFAIDEKTSVGYSVSPGGGAGVTYSFDASRVVQTANENRPRNIAFLYIVRAA